jgi:small-conductance mechanosensitive channel
MAAGANAEDFVARIYTTYQGPVNTVFVLLIVFVAYRMVTRTLRKHLLAKSHSPENVQNFLFFWRYAWFGVAAVFAIVTFSGSIASIGISAAFLGMIMGWSLQAPVTGLAGWLMIVLARPFKIGDRIIIAGIIGDVTDITLTHVILNQVGGTIGGEEKSGRGVLIPNATLFQQIIYNYAFETQNLLDEVPIMITFESDYREAERICVKAASEVTKDIIAHTGTQPFVRSEITDWGMRLRVRYQTVATDRQRISTEICVCILEGFKASKRVEFAYPHSEILHRPKPPLDVSPQPPKASESTQKPSA